MSAPARERAGPAEYAPPDAPEPTEVRLVGVDAQVVSPAWELELLVTGIVLVGLFQLPPWLQGVWRHWEPHLSVPGLMAGAVVVMVGQAALYALIICFTIALALRGFWVALVGTNSVFPNGVRWDKQREYGPIQAEVIRRRVRPLPSFIGRANSAASLVFAAGFVVAGMTVASLGMLAATLALFWLLTLVVPVRIALAVFAGIGFAITAAAMGAWAFDVRRGATLAPGGRADRALRGLMRGMTSMNPAALSSLNAVLTSNVSKRVTYTAMVLGFGGAYLSAQLNMAHSAGLPGASNYAFFTDAQRAGVVDAALYDSLRGDEAPVNTPSIQSDIVTDPYVRLFVPYRPVRHNAALQRACPGLKSPPGDDGGAGADGADAAVLACVAKVHAVTLDGRPLARAGFHFFINPRTERRGFLMLIPAANLAPGEHVLTVQPARADPTPARPGPADTASIRIPFWR